MVKSYLSKLLAFVLAVVISFFGGFNASANAESIALTGDYTADTLVVLENLRDVMALPADTDIQEKKERQAEAKQQMNDYISRYRKNSKYNGLKSFTTMQTALNSLAGYYATFGSRPLSDSLNQRLTQEFRQVEFALKKGF